MRARLFAPEGASFAGRHTGSSRRVFSVLLVRELGGDAAIGKNLRHVSHIADLSRQVFEMAQTKEMIMTPRLNPFAAGVLPCNCGSTSETPFCGAAWMSA